MVFYGYTFDDHPPTVMANALVKIPSYLFNSPFECAVANTVNLPNTLPKICREGNESLTRTP